MDPWVHRSDGMKCKTCMWFAPKVPMPEPVQERDYVSSRGADRDFTEATTDSVPVHVGRCRRHAPTMNGYPVVFVNDWCGDHKLNENEVG